MITEDDLLKLGYVLKSNSFDSDESSNDYVPMVYKHSHSIKLTNGIARVDFPVKLNIKSVPFKNIEKLREWYFKIPSKQY